MKIAHEMCHCFLHLSNPIPAKRMEEWEHDRGRERQRKTIGLNLFNGYKRKLLGNSSMCPFPQSCCLGNILFVQFDKGIQSGKNTFYIHNVGIALDAVAPMVFAEILSKEFIDMTGQKNVD
jgi:hypothetical protein